MADITAKLVWYRLVETFKSAAEAWSDSTSSRRLYRFDVLDMLFIGWLVAALVLIGIVNLYIRWFGSKRCGNSSGGGAAGASKFTSSKYSGQSSGWNGSDWTSIVWGDRSSAGETVNWINTALTWLGEQRQNAAVVDAILKELTVESNKHLVSLLFLFIVK
jgi:hypothetical protein